jgi:hypothetical protein
LGVGARVGENISYKTHLFLVLKFHTSMVWCLIKCRDNFTLLYFTSNHLHIPITHLSSSQRGMYYSGVKLFNTLPSNISALKNDKNQFRFTVLYLSILLHFCTVHIKLICFI